jgi:hypothetical protein
MSERDPYVDTLVSITERVIDSLAQIKMKMETHVELQDKDLDAIKAELLKIINLLDNSGVKHTDLSSEMKEITKGITSGISGIMTKLDAIIKGYEGTSKLIKWLMAVQGAVTAAGIGIYMIIDKLISSAATHAK